eukprot:3072817-Rhodomonas_salina.1
MPEGRKGNRRKREEETRRRRRRKGSRKKRGAETELAEAVAAPGVDVPGPRLRDHKVRADGEGGGLGALVEGLQQRRHVFALREEEEV